MSHSNHGPQAEGNADISKSAFLKISEVVRYVGLSRSTIYAMAKRGDFPQQVQLSPGRVGMPSSEVIAWKQARIEARNRRR